MSTMFSLLLAAAALGAGARAPAADPSPAPADAPAATRQLDFGMAVTAQGGAFRNFVGVVTVPGDWPGEQRVRTVKEDLPPGAAVAYKTIPDVGRQMQVRIPMLPPGKEVRAVVTFEVESFAPTHPQDTGRFTAADRAKLGPSLAGHLEPSPLIECKHPIVRKAAEEVVGEQKTAWDQVKTIHEWVHQNIKYSGDLENKQACTQTLGRREGACAEKNSLAVAMLRATGIPARLIRVPGHCYYEVYLLDGEGAGHWLPGDASAKPTIDVRSESHGVILQKGDNVNMIDPKTRRPTKGRFLSESATGLPQGRGVTLQFQPITPAISAKPKTKP